MPANKLPISSYALIAANLIPLIGVLFFEWDAVLVLALFWIENLIIGAFNVVRIITGGIVTKDPSAIFICVFFIFHYGLFCSVHGQLLTDLLNYPAAEYTDYFAATSFGLLQLFLEGAATMLMFIEKLSPDILFGIAALILSRLISFIENFILKGEVFTLKVKELMARPYGQIIVMHIGLIVGAVLLEQFGSPIWLLVVIVALKIMVDFNQHQKRHKRQLNELIKDL